jgi:hypothetical protein
MLLRALLILTVIPAALFAAEKPNDWVGSKACITCHAREFDSWRKTPMGNASGRASDGLITGSFTHSGTEAHFEVARAANGNPVIHYQKSIQVGEWREEIKGTIPLEYFVGSGKRGRTYLFQREGWWFETPVNWYSKKRVWDMPPGLQSATEIPLTLRVDQACLHCHATNVTRAAAESRNKFGTLPFTEGGIGCEACHGPGGDHVRSKGKVALPDVSRLAAPARDAICMQCHLEAEFVVNRAARDKFDYRPGEDLLTYSDYFFRPTKEKLRAVSQFESLWDSKCRLASGDKMTCTTCHDPHATVVAEDRVSHYRERCVTCHGEQFARSHKNGDPNCIGCHMPTRHADVAHEEATDHRILRTPDAFKVNPSDELMHFPPGSSAGAREAGIAYSQLAGRKSDKATIARAKESLVLAVHKGARDAETLAALGFIQRTEGKLNDALESYEAALQSGSKDPFVINDAAALYANSRKTGEALRLWKQGFEANPWQSELGMNIASLYCALGDAESAGKALDRVLEFNPDQSAARKMRRELNAVPTNRQGGTRCPASSQ